MALSRKFQELAPENDGMHHLRQKIQKIIHSDLSHETRGEQLHSLMTASHRNALQLKPQASARKCLLPGTITPPRLIELPSELIEAIALSLDLRSLKHFRLTCKAFQAKSIHYFRCRYFTERVVGTDWNSLRTLMMILNHQDLGPGLRDLVIDGPQQDQRSPGRRLPAEPIRRRGLFSYSYQPVRASKNGSSSQHLSMLLERIFDKAGSLNSLSFKPRTLSASQSTTPYYTENSVDVLERTLQALTTAAVTLTSLALGAEDANGYSFFSLCDLRDEILASRTDLTRSFRNIHTMTLVFNVSHLKPEMPPKRFPSLLLNLAPNLKILELHLDPCTSRSAFDCFTHVATSTHLTMLFKVTIAQAAIDTSSLRALLSPSTNTLREVYLSDICLVQLELNVSTLKTYLAGELTLEKAELRDMGVITVVSLYENSVVRVSDAKLGDGIWTEL
jgi:hypothetical protein